MKQDLDTLMKSRGLDCILVTGPGQHNPALVYLTGGGHLTQADLIKKCGEAPVLFHYSMERDEAAKTGLETKSLEEYSPVKLLEKAGGDPVKARAMRYQLMLQDVGITNGRIGLYGKIDAGIAFATFDGLQKLSPELSILGELDDSILLQAMATKDTQEVERIRKMGKITVDVVGKVADFIASHGVKDQVVLKADGEPLTIGDVKSKINIWLAEHSVDNPHGCVFSIGRDSAVPHSSGSATDWLRTGQTIVFDIYPCEAGGGYFYDFTRTWCLEYAPEPVEQLYQDVYDVFQKIMGELTANKPCYDYQQRTCEMFEDKGHPTVKSNPRTEEGYVHSLGHGVGLNLHERPWFGKNATSVDVLAPGSVFTVEPGLYYPDRCMGVRLEDSVWVRPDGRMEVLAQYPMELVIPMKR